MISLLHTAELFVLLVDYAQCELSWLVGCWLVCGGLQYSNGTSMMYCTGCITELT